MFRGRTCRGQHSLPGRDNWTQGGTFRDRRGARGRGIGRGYRLGGGRGTAYFERGLKFEEDGLLHEDFLALVAESLDLGLEEVDLLGHFGVPDRKQLLDDVVNINLDLPLHGLYLNLSELQLLL